MTTSTTYTGQLGVALLVDDQITNKAIQLATQYRQGNSMELGVRHLPHITLYHSKLQNVPIGVIKDQLKELTSMLPISLSFTTVDDFGGKFLFWNIERTRQLAKAHEQALVLSKYFTPLGEQQADKEKIDLSPAETANVRGFGYAFIGDLWRPHITLGYYPVGVQQDLRTEKFEGKVASVAFIRVGEAGTIAEILSQ